MAISWAISIDGGPGGPLSELGLSRPTRTLHSMAPDVVRLVAPGAAADSAAVMDRGQLVEIFRDGIRWFYGRVERILRHGSPSEEGLEYEIVGPWWYLDHLVYQLAWNIYDQGTNTLIPQYKSHLILGSDLSGNPITTATQLADIINYAATQGAPIKLGSGAPALYTPTYEIVDTTCGEVIRKLARWWPDAVSWFDYTTTPPTLYVRQRNALTAAAIALADTEQHESIEITPRHDLQVSAVHLTYEANHEVNGKIYPSATPDAAPPGATGREFQALVATVDLQGQQLTLTQAAVEVESFDASHLTESNRLAWWKSKKPVLADAHAKDLSIDVLSVACDPPWDAETHGGNNLVQGQLAEWMEEGGVPVTGTNMTVTCEVSYTLLKDPNGSSTDPDNILWQGTEKVSVRSVVTNAESRTYTNVESYTAAEPVPSGLAAALYAALSVLHYEGSVSLVEEECSGRVGVGNKLNLTGGMSAWASMNALVQTITEDFESGRTTIQFGPPAHLGIPDFIELLRLNRTRRNWTPSATRTTGEAASGAGVELGSKVAVQNTSHGPSEAVQKTWSESTETQGKVRIALVDIPEPRRLPTTLLKIREVDVCVLVSTDPDVYVNKKMLVLASDTYAGS